MSPKTFAELGVSEPAVRALSARGIDAPFAIQQLVIEDALEGHDIMAQSPTGSGKTLAFVLPVLEQLEAGDRTPTALVLAPTRELAGQIAEEARDIAAARNLRVATVYGGVGFGPQIKAAKAAHLLVATPGRLIDLIDRRAVNLRNVDILVLDEADRMLDMGFKPAVDRIVSELPAERQTLFFSATLEGEAGKVAAKYTSNPRRHVHIPIDALKPQVDHHFVDVLHEDKVETLLHHLTMDERGLALVFVRTKRGADRLAKRLDKQGINAAAIHGDKSQNQRERALARFTAGKLDTLIATDVAARGIDVDDVTHVINYDVPEDSDTYVHRTGRTGRAGRTGTALTFVLADQRRDMGKIAHGLGIESDLPSGAQQPQARRNDARPSRRRRTRR
mgnify:CR=1 FL=1